MPTKCDLFSVNKNLIYLVLLVGTLENLEPDLDLSK